MKLNVRDIVSHQGRDFIVEGILTYKVDGRTLPLARTLDGKDVRWVEPLLDELDDRLLIFEEVNDLHVNTPPPTTIAYNGKSYVPKFSGTAVVTLSGRVPGRTAGNIEVWRYRAGGDVYLQIERWPEGVVVLVGESVHKGMVDVLPAGEA